MANRLKNAGGPIQQERMIRDKQRSLNKALLYSYQAAKILRNTDDSTVPIKCLINPNKLTQDYDEKILSVPLEYNFKPGDIITWIGTNTKWLIYLQELTELAYFRGNMRRCQYQVFWQDPETSEKHSTYISVRGPVETKINSITKNDMVIDLPNYSLLIMMPKNEYTLKYFQRYSKFYIPDLDIPENKTCWRVEAVDSISTPGIISFTAVEYYSNEFTDNVEDGIVNEAIVKPVDPNPIGGLIEGDTFIKPKISYNYKYLGTDKPKWNIDKKYPIIIKQISDNEIQLKWDSAYSGQFILSCNSESKTIVVESLF